MAINDYASLQSAVARWLARTDLTDSIPDFISLAEARINRDLRVRQMISTTGVTASSGSFNLPADFISPVLLKTSVGGIEREVQPMTSFRHDYGLLG